MSDCLTVLCGLSTFKTASYVLGTKMALIWWNMSTLQTTSNCWVEEKSLLLINHSKMYYFSCCQSKFLACQEKKWTSFNGTTCQHPLIPGMCHFVFLGAFVRTQRVIYHEVTNEGIDSRARTSIPALRCEPLREHLACCSQTRAATVRSLDLIVPVAGVLIL